MFKKLIKMTKEKQTPKTAVNQTAQEKPIQWENAVILKAEVAAVLFRTLEEMPIKHSNQILPLLKELEQAPRTTINVTPRKEEQ